MTISNIYLYMCVFEGRPKILIHQFSFNIASLILLYIFKPYGIQMFIWKRFD